MESTTDQPHVSIFVQNKANQRFVGAAVYQRDQNVSLETAANEKTLMKLQLFEFLDNDQFSNLDCFLNQIGSAIIYLPEDINDKAKGDSRKVFNIVNSKDCELHHLKKTCFAKKSETSVSLMKLIGKTSHATNSVDAEMPIALGCVECLLQTLKLLEEDSANVVYELSYGALDTCMRLDSAAAEAVNLLPKPDHPSQFGSLYGILNRCRTKLGSRLLDRWLRQPLLDEVEINNRLEVVQAFVQNTHHRNELRDGALKAVPDLDTVIHKMHKPTAGLDEVFRLYLFVRSIPSLTTTLEHLIDSLRDTSGGVSSAATPSCSADILCEKFLQPLQSIAAKFRMYEQLVEHVVDLQKLPELKVNASHDADLQELQSEQEGLLQRAEKVYQDCRSSWGSFADVKLESNPQHGFILRTTRADDERQLRANYSAVRIISILKNGVHFTTPALERIAERYLTIQTEYEAQQSVLVAQALETARTYLPVVEAVAALIAELDVLVAFATAAALSPGVYVRPTVLKRGSGIIDLKGARHPCVELMDATSNTSNGQQFIANDYDLIRGESSFQIVTGPNMGGKSTYIRGVGCILVLAQIGMFVPCDSATVTVTDCILARVGAGDAVQKGVSTFMAEMLESAVLLQTATADSLIIIDELGRGTSTFDGFGLAWSISDYIVTQLKCACLFATHFHELTALEKQYPRSVVNKHVSAHVHNNQVVMLYQLARGPCTQSFGIHVARTADFPACVIAEAKRKAHVLEHSNLLLVTAAPKHSSSSDVHGSDSTTMSGSDVNGSDVVGSGSSAGDVSKMRRKLGEFSALQVPALLAEQVVEHVKSIFGGSAAELMM